MAIFKKETQKNTRPVALTTTNGKPQTKLTIGQSDDKYEREADRVADQVVKNTRGTASQASGIQQVQKMGEEEEVQAKPMPGIQREADEELQAKSDDSTGNVASSAVSSQINQSKGSGSALSGEVRTQMESGIGADFSKVRVHTDSRAENLSTQLHAQAFTVGNDVYFNKGKYNPNSYSGRHLLAHELTHTVQQGGALQKKIQKQDEPLVPVPDTQLSMSPAMYALTLDNFTTGKDFLTKEHTTALDAQLPLIMSALKSDPAAYIIVAGHTDAVGKDGDNQSLSEKRAATVVNYLLSKGLSASQIKSSAHGESQLRKKSKVDESVNRRVEISLSKVNQRLEADLTLKKDTPPKEPENYKDLFPKYEYPDPNKLDIESMDYVYDNARPVNNDLTFDKGLSNAADSLLDTLGIKNKDIRSLAKKGIIKGVESGIDAGVDAAIQGLGEQEKKAIKTFIKTYKKYGLKKGETSNE